MEIVGKVDHYSLTLSFQTCLIIIVSPQNFLISSVVILGHFIVLSDTFHCEC